MLPGRRASSRHQIRCAALRSACILDVSARWLLPPAAVYSTCLQMRGVIPGPPQECYQHGNTAPYGTLLPRHHFLRCMHPQRVPVQTGAQASHNQAGLYNTMLALQLQLPNEAMTTKPPCRPSARRRRHPCLCMLTALAFALPPSNRHAPCHAESASMSIQQRHDEPTTPRLRMTAKQRKCN